MGLLYKISDKELLELRNKIFLEKGVPSLKSNDFHPSPFSTAWFGKNNLGDFTYELCRVTNGSILETITGHISKGDTWIKIFLNVFKLTPEIKFITQLKGVDGLQYHLPPNILTSMRLRVDDFKGMPLFNCVEHRLKSFNSKKGLQKREQELGNLIQQDLTDINSFVNSWYKLHKPIEIDWEGNKI